METLALYVVVFNQWGRIESELVFGDGETEARKNFAQKHAEAIMEIEILTVKRVFDDV